jgi:hypothetical protein
MRKFWACCLFLAFAVATQAGGRVGVGVGIGNGAGIGDGAAAGVSAGVGDKAGAGVGVGVRVADFKVKAFHIDLRIQVMKMPALKQLAQHLHDEGINTIIMEWEGSFPYAKEAIISNELAYSRAEIKDYIEFCRKLGIDVIPLQQTFGHVEYILKNYKYAALREDTKDFSQVCPVELAKNKALFTELIKDMISLHQSEYVHIGGDETFLLGHCPKCQKKVAESGLSKLYFDHIKMICDIVTALGKKPVLWADIALHYPENISLLPKETVFVDWNYGWALDRFGQHKKLLASGYEIWGAPAIRSEPDNFYLEKWKNHFDNIATFIPKIRELNYAGVVMTSWSTSGAYSTVFDSHEDPLLLFPVRRVYPISAFNILIDAYTSAIRSDKPLDAEAFIVQYGKDRYGLSGAEAMLFQKALLTAPYPVIRGEIKEKANFTLRQLIDSANQSLGSLEGLKPVKNVQEFAHYILMAGIRSFYLQVLQAEAEMNAPGFTIDSRAEYAVKLTKLEQRSVYLNKRFGELNKDLLYPGEIGKENDYRNYKLNDLLGRMRRH